MKNFTGLHPRNMSVSTLETSVTFAYELLLFGGLTSPQA